MVQWVIGVDSNNQLNPTAEQLWNGSVSHVSKDEIFHLNSRPGRLSNNGAFSCTTFIQLEGSWRLIRSVHKAEAIPTFGTSSGND